MPRVVLPDLNLDNAERLLVTEALRAAESIPDAAELLGISRQRLKRMMLKHRIAWPLPRSTEAP